MESDKLYENINNKTLQDKLTIIDKFKLKLVDYIESELIFQDEKTLEEDLGQIGLTFTEYKSYSQYLRSIIRFSKEDKMLLAGAEDKYSQCSSQYRVTYTNFLDLRQRSIIEKLL